MQTPLAPGSASPQESGGTRLIYHVRRRQDEVQRQQGKRPSQHSTARMNNFFLKIECKQCKFAANSAVKKIIKNSELNIELLEQSKQRLNEVNWLENAPPSPEEHKSGSDFFFTAGLIEGVLMKESGFYASVA